MTGAGDGDRTHDVHLGKVVKTYLRRVFISLHNPIIPNTDKAFMGIVGF